MGLFDTIRAELPCPVCGSTKEREIQTKQGPCAMLNFEVGDTIEPFIMATTGWKRNGIVMIAGKGREKKADGTRLLSIA